MLQTERQRTSTGREKEGCCEMTAGASTFPWARTRMVAGERRPPQAGE